jgi:hypothetical protein
MLGCPKVYSALEASESLSYLEGPQSDHRGLFVDLDPLQILQTTTTQTISTPNARLLKSGNPELVEAYQTAMNDYYTEHSMVERLDKIHEKQATLSKPCLRKLLEQWDADQGRAMKHAEQSLSRPKKSYTWSPLLRNAGLEYRY